MLGYNLIDCRPNFMLFAGDYDVTIECLALIIKAEKIQCTIHTRIKSNLKQCRRKVFHFNYSAINYAAGVIASVSMSLLA